MTTHGTLAPDTPAIEPRPPRARLRQSSLVWALTATHFVSRAGGMVRSFLVLYLTQERQLSPTMAGAVVAAVGVGDVGSQLLGGWLGDRIGRRHTMLVGFLGTAVALVALGSAETMPAICAAAVGVGLMAELFRPAGSAAVADLPAQERVRAFGLLFWAANLGFTVSTVAAGVLAQQGYGILFWINAAASVLAALIVWRHVPETRPPTPKATRRALLPVLLRDPVMLAMAAIHVVYFATFLQTFSTLPLVMAGDGHGPGTYGAVLALNGIVIVVVQPIAVRLLEGRDRASVLAVSMLLVGVGGGLGAVVHSGASHAGVDPRVDPRRDRHRRHVRRHLCRPRAGRPTRPIHGRRLHHVEPRRRAGTTARRRAARPRWANRAVGGMLGDRARAVRRAAGCRPGTAPPNLRPAYDVRPTDALGGQEPWEEPPGRSWLPASGWWWRRHDEYEQEINDSRNRCRPPDPMFPITPSGARKKSPASGSSNSTERATASSGP